jgi:hypothetical protein
MKKIKPPTYLAMLKSRLKFRTVPKKKRKRGNVISNVPKQKKEMKPYEKNCFTMSKVQVEV